MNTLTIEEAYTQFRAAENKLKEAVAAELPPGTEIYVRIGNAQIRAEVGEQCWSNPLRIRITNVETGKRREISVDPKFGNAYRIVD